MLSRVTDRVVLAGSALIIVQLVFRGWFSFATWFQFDDLVFLTRVNGAPLDADLLLEGYGGHFMPSGFLLTWLFGHDGALSYAPYALTLLCLQALASLGFLMLLRSLFGSRWAILVPLTLYLFLALTFPAFIWWAAGVNQLALQVALGWGLWAHLRYLRSRRTRWALATLAILIVCLSFYEKVILVQGAIAILTLSYFASGTLTERVVHVFRTYRAAVLLHVVLGLAYLTVYVRFAFNFGDSGGDTAPGLELMWNMLGEAVIPASIGGPIQWQVHTGAFQVADPPGLLVVASWVLLAALVIHLAVATDRSLRAWLLPLFFFACGAVLLGSARASAFGAAVGLEFRYVTELGLLLPLALALARLPIPGAVESAEPRADIGSPILGNRERLVAATALVAVLGTISTWQFARHWVDNNEARTYFDNADQSLGTSQDPTPLVNVSVPESIMWGYEYPANTTKYVLRSYADRMSFPEHSVDRLSMIGPDGTVQPVSVSPMQTSRPTSNKCGYAARPGDSAAVPLQSVASGDDLWARMSYHAPEATTVTIRAGEKSHEVDLAKGLHNVFLRVSGTFSRITVNAPGSADGPICLYEANVGVPFISEQPSPEEGS